MASGPPRGRGCHPAQQFFAFAPGTSPGGGLRGAGDGRLGRGRRIRHAPVEVCTCVPPSSPRHRDSTVQAHEGDAAGRHRGQFTKTSSSPLSAAGTGDETRGICFHRVRRRRRAIVRNLAHCRAGSTVSIRVGITREVARSDERVGFGGPRCSSVLERQVRYEVLVSVTTRDLSRHFGRRRVARGHRLKVWAVARVFAAAPPVDRASPSALVCFAVGRQTRTLFRVESCRPEPERVVRALDHRVPILAGGRLREPASPTVCCRSCSSVAVRPVLGSGRSRVLSVPARRSNEGPRRELAKRPASTLPPRSPSSAPTAIPGATRG